MPDVQKTLYWWEEKKDEAHKTVFKTLEQLNKIQGWMREGNIRNMRLYGNMNVLAMAAGTYAPNNALNQPYDRLSLNVIQSCCDTVTEQICKNQPRPMFLTEGGDFKLQEKAKKLNRFIDGQFYATGIYKQNKGPAVFRDATIFGSGYLKIFRKEKEILVERKFPGLILVDENDGMFGNPRCMYELAYYPKEYLKRLYPDYQSEIESMSAAPDFFDGNRKMGDYIWVAEAWRLSTNKDSKDGRHIICIGGCTFLDETYVKTRFPFAKIDWSQRLLGYQGQPLAEQLMGIQIEINKILRDIQITMHLYKPKYLIEAGSKIIKAHLNNEIGGLVYWQGIKPEIMVPVAVPQEWFAHLDNLYQKAYQIAGVSQLSSQAQKPQGLNSGKAIREFNDIESERHILAGKAWEQFHLDASDLMIDCAMDIAEEYGDHEVMTREKDRVLKVKWSEIDLKEDQYMMQAYPTSFLSKTPAGKLQDVIELSQAGFLDKEASLKLLDFPDLQGITKYLTAGTDDIMRVIEEITYEGKYSRPEPFQKLDWGIKMVQSAYLWARDNKVPESRLNMLRNWMEEAHRLLQTAQAAAMPPAGPEQGMPAAPMPIPQNEMLPQVG